MTAPVIEDDPFATPEDVNKVKPTDPAIPRRGRYYLPNRDGSKKPWGWMRMTNLVSAFSDQKQLQNWEMRTALAGLATNPDLMIRLQQIIAETGVEPEAIKDAQGRILDLADEAKDRVGGGRGRERGNRVHALVEADHLEIPYALTVQEHELLRLIRKALVEAHLKPIKGMQERIILLEEFEVCGKLDDLLQCEITGTVHVGDTKTQKRFWSWLEVEAQLSGYSRAVAFWNREAGRWEDVPFTIDRTQGAILWCPPQDHSPTGQIHAEIKRVDLVRGYETLKIAYSNVRQRSAAKSAKQAISGTAWVPVSNAETWGRRFAEVETVADGQRLVEQAKAAGAWGPEVKQAAAAAADRIARKSLAYSA